MSKKVKKTTFIVDPQDEKLFEDVVFLVEANSYESHSLWERFHYKPHEGYPHIKDWKDVSLGHMICIGEIKKRPICVTVHYAIINGKKICFYDGVSALVDNTMINEWLDYWFFDRIKWEMGRKPICDAMNFHNCLQAIGALDKWREENEKEKKK
jgi:hypothetical protein